MGISEDISWLRENEDGVGRIFRSIAESGESGERGLRQLYEELGIDDWWPAKCHVQSLIDRGLITEIEGRYELTDHGQRVKEGLVALGFLKPI